VNSLFSPLPSLLATARRHSGHAGQTTTSHVSSSVRQPQHELETVNPSIHVNDQNQNISIVSVSSSTTTNETISQGFGVRIGVSEGAALSVKVPSTMIDASSSKLEGRSTTDTPIETRIPSGEINSALSIPQNIVQVDEPNQPYGLPACLEMLRVLVQLIDPRNRAHTDNAHRIVALGLLGEVVWGGIGGLGEWVHWGADVLKRRKITSCKKGSISVHEEESEEEKMAVSVHDLVINELCKYLFQVTQCRISRM